jgi:hypothetical protein
VLHITSLNETTGIGKALMKEVRKQTDQVAVNPVDERREKRAR